MAPTSIDGTEITGATIDGQDVSEITVDGETVFTAIPDSLLYHYTFDGGDLTDQMGNGPALTNNGATLTSTAVSGDAFDFAGNDVSRLEGSNATELDGLNEVSVAMWIRPDTTNQPQDFAFPLSFADTFDGNSGDPQFSFADFGTSIRFDAAGGRAASSNQLSANTYTLVTGTYNSGNITLYYNDANQQATDSGGASSTLTNTHNLMFIGDSAFSDNDDTLDGKIDEVKFYDKELSSTEVSNLFNTGSING